MRIDASSDPDLIGFSERSGDGYAQCGASLFPEAEYARTIHATWGRCEEYNRLERPYTYRIRILVHFSKIPEVVNTLGHDLAYSRFPSVIALEVDFANSDYAIQLLSAQRNQRVDIVRSHLFACLENASLG